MNRVVIEDPGQRDVAIDLAAVDPVVSRQRRGRIDAIIARLRRVVRVPVLH